MSCHPPPTRFRPTDSSPQRTEYNKAIKFRGLRVDLAEYDVGLQPSRPASPPPPDQEETTTHEETITSQPRGPGDSMLALRGGDGLPCTIAYGTDQDCIINLKVLVLKGEQRRTYRGPPKPLIWDGWMEL